MQTDTNREDIEVTFREVYASYLHKVRFFAFHYLQDQQAAKCVAQEVFITVWENRDSVIFDENIMGYLLTVTKNKCLNILRRKKTESSFNNFKKDQYDRDSLNFMALKDSSSTDLYAKEVEKIFRSSVDQMPEKIKEAFLLNRFNNLKYTEIAEKQRVNIKTIEYRMMCALKILRSNLKDYLPLL